MGTSKKDVICMEVASDIVECIAVNYPGNFQDPAVLEGIFLAMQMIAGPQEAARMISHCIPKVG